MEMVNGLLAAGAAAAATDNYVCQNDIVMCVYKGYCNVM